MKNESVTITVSYHAQPGKEAVARAELAALIATVQQREPDCLGITLHQHQDDPRRFLLFERWTSRAAYEGDHFRTEHLRAFIARAPQFLAGPPGLDAWSAV